MQIPLSLNSRRDLYERARILDESNQSVRDAIRLYSQFISLAKADRAYAALAQYRIGMLYNRIGRKEDARRAFKSVVSQYPDQVDLVSRARSKIDAAANRKRENGMEIKRTGASPGGRFLATFTFPPGVSVSRPVIDEKFHRLYVVAGSIADAQEDEKIGPDARKVGGYVYGPSTLVVIDSISLAIVKTIPFPVCTGGIALSTANNKLYTSEFLDGHVRVIDRNTFATLARIRAPGYPMEPLVNPATNRIYVASQGFPGNDRLSIIDPITNSIAWTEGVGGSLSGLAINSATNRIYVQREQSTRVLDGEDGSVITDLAQMCVVAADPVGNRIYAQQVRGHERPVLYVLDGNTHGILATLPYENVSYNGGIDADSRVNRLYVATPSMNQIIVIDATAHTEVNRFSITQPESLTTDRVTGKVYVRGRLTSNCMQISVLSKEALEEEAPPEEFFDDFDGPELDPAWTVRSGKNTYSLTQSPGRLRYSISEATERPHPVMARKFRGEYWTLEMKVSYFMSATGGGRDSYLGVSFGDPIFVTQLRPDANAICLNRRRDDWNGCCPGEVGNFFVEKGAQFSFVREPPNSADTYVYRIKRNHRTVTIERSDDGISFTQPASHTFESQIDGHLQHLVFGYQAHGLNNGYVDIEFVRLSAGNRLIRQRPRP